MARLISPKPFLGYPDMVALLRQRGMQIACPSRAERELARLGYYRLSGFWYPSRVFALDPAGRHLVCPHTDRPVRLDDFQPGTLFDAAVDLYRFDKALRLLMLEAIETVEVHLKTLFAHELGRNDSLAYASPALIEPMWIGVKPGFNQSKWDAWKGRQQKKLEDSSEECLQWHRLTNRAIPFWVAVEAWDFGTLSIYFQLLKRKPQGWILARLGLSDVKAFKSWLRAINTLRNRCAHHTRVWNQSDGNPIVLPAAEPYFRALNLDANARKRMYGLISVLWFLLRRIDPGSDWIGKVADLIDSKPRMPGCTFDAMGFATEAGFPRNSFAA
ncbi:Abi family protein [Pseudomonas sp. TE3610]